MKNPNESDYLCKCPFCGDDDVKVYKWNQSSFWSVSCGDDNCPMSSCLENRFESKEKAVFFWNHRYGIKYTGTFDRHSD